MSDLMVLLACTGAACLYAGFGLLSMIGFDCLIKVRKFFRGTDIELLLILFFWPVALISCVLYFLILRPLIRIYEKFFKKRENEENNREGSQEESCLPGINTVSYDPSIITVPRVATDTLTTHYDARARAARPWMYNFGVSFQTPTSDLFGASVGEPVEEIEENQEYTKFGEWIKNVEKTYSYKK